MIKNVSNVKPLRSKVLVKNLQFGEFRTKSGIILTDDDGIQRGIHPRWAEVWRVGEDVFGLQEGDWVLIEHGRWSRTVKVSVNDEEFRINEIDYPNGILLISNEKPTDENLRSTGLSR